MITKTEKTQNRVKQDAEESFLEGKTAILIGTNENLQNILTELENTTKPKLKKQIFWRFLCLNSIPKSHHYGRNTRVCHFTTIHSSDRSVGARSFLAFQENQSFVIRQDGLFSARNDLFQNMNYKLSLSGAQNLPDTVLNLAFRKQLLENGVRFLPVKSPHKKPQTMFFLLS